MTGSCEEAWKGLGKRTVRKHQTKDVLGIIREKCDCCVDGERKKNESRGKGQGLSPGVWWTKTQPHAGAQGRRSTHETSGCLADRWLLPASGPSLILWVNSLISILTC